MELIYILTMLAVKCSRLFSTMSTSMHRSLFCGMISGYNKVNDTINANCIYLHYDIIHSVKVIIYMFFYAYG